MTVVQLWDTMCVSCVAHHAFASSIKRSRTALRSAHSTHRLLSHFRAPARAFRKKCNICTRKVSPRVTPGVVHAWTSVSRSVARRTPKPFMTLTRGPNACPLIGVLRCGRVFDLAHFLFRSRICIRATVPAFERGLIRESREEGSWVVRRQGASEVTHYIWLWWRAARSCAARRDVRKSKRSEDAVSRDRGTPRMAPDIQLALCNLVRCACPRSNLFGVHERHAPEFCGDTIVGVCGVQTSSCDSELPHCYPC